MQQRFRMAQLMSMNGKQEALTPYGCDVLVHARNVHDSKVALLHRLCYMYKPDASPQRRSVESTDFMHPDLPCFDSIASSCARQ